MAAGIPIPVRAVAGATQALENLELAQHDPAPQDFVNSSERSSSTEPMEDLPQPGTSAESCRSFADTLERANSNDATFPIKENVAMEEEADVDEYADFRAGAIYQLMVGPPVTAAGQNQAAQCACATPRTRRPFHIRWLASLVCGVCAGSRGARTMPTGGQKALLLVPLRRPAYV
mmetsp:Transcript_32039/g.81570  ORF Transcript_32039/g.81570 Transcript_32039/m.81570 type:complete len:175 (-) Transcript_32039:1646-2170(-)